MWCAQVCCVSIVLLRTRHSTNTVYISCEPRGHKVNLGGPLTFHHSSSALLLYRKLHIESSIRNFHFLIPSKSVVLKVCLIYKMYYQDDASHTVT